MEKTVVSNPDVETLFYYSGGNTVGITVKENGVEILNEEFIEFDTQEEAKDYFEKINSIKNYNEKEGN